MLSPDMMLWSPPSFNIALCLSEDTENSRRGQKGEVGYNMRAPWRALHRHSFSLVTIGTISLLVAIAYDPRNRHSISVIIIG